MAISFCAVQTDPQGKELTEHGTSLFPVSCHDEDLRLSPVAWHWHEDLEVLIITEGNALLSAGSDRFSLSQGQGFFINAGILHAVRAARDSCCRLRSLVFHPRLIGGSLDSIFWQNYVHPLIQNEALKYTPLMPGKPAFWSPPAMSFRCVPPCHACSFSSFPTGRQTPSRLRKKR